MGEAPKPPTALSPNGEEAWDWADKFSTYVHRNDALRKLKAIVYAAPRCGDCQLWMTRRCPRETNSMSGFSRGPSCNEVVCQVFQVTAQAVWFKEQKVQELQALENAP